MLIKKRRITLIYVPFRFFYNALFLGELRRVNTKKRLRRIKKGLSLSSSFGKCMKYTLFCLPSVFWLLLLLLCVQHARMLVRSFHSLAAYMRFDDIYLSDRLIYLTLKFFLRSMPFVGILCHTFKHI